MCLYLVVPGAECCKREGYILQVHDLPTRLNPYIGINLRPILRLSIGVAPPGNGFLVPSPVFS